MVARALVECGVPSGCMTSLRTRYASLRLASGYRATGFSTQSELLPSACIVELPSKPQFGRSESVGGFSNALRRVLPRSSGTGFLPSSHMYSNLYFFMGCVGSVGSKPTVDQNPERMRIPSLGLSVDLMDLKGTRANGLGPIH